MSAAEVITILCSWFFCLIVVVLKFKAKGNAHLQKKEFDAAIEAYTRAIELEPSDHIFYSNRSSAYLSLGEAFKALEDADACVGLAPSWPKGYSRRGQSIMSAMMQCIYFIHLNLWRYLLYRRRFTFTETLQRRSECLRGRTQDCAWRCGSKRRSRWAETRAGIFNTGPKISTAPSTAY